MNKWTWFAIGVAAMLVTATAMGDHFNDPNDGKYSFTPQQCHKFGKTKTVPCDRDWFNKMWYLNEDGIMVFNNNYCTGMGRGAGGFKPECWLSTKNSDRGYYEVAGDAIACWD